MKIEKRDFEVIAVKEGWAVLRKVTESTKRGGGSPEAIVHKDSCEVLRVSLSR
ncbi:hypothetical protein ACL7TT_15425 [Microbulbifer sp. 2304DJ12-6]|uniref:hypothetical protein n=1 Tax=Microbulbifer sp. 2304DJ12-6 TaxID=3233340 RepID=UPI0039AFD358